MEFIICDSDKMEVSLLPDGATADFDIGDTNDIELTVSNDDGIENGMFVICPGTEYGGPLEESESDTSSTSVTWRGDTFRGLLDQYIIEPPSGEDYRTVSGDAHTIMQEIIGDAFDGLFTVPDTNSGITINSYSFNRYTSALSGFTKMLAEYDARINLEIVQGGPGEAFYVELTAAEINNLSEEIEYSQDSNISVTITEAKRGINHLICLGQGELADRTVIHLYLQSDGSVSQEQYYTGFQERTAVYDYSSVESEEELISSGTERLLELAPSNTMEMTVNEEEEDIQIGDIIAGRNYDTGLYIASPIVKKIVRIQDGIVSVEYGVEGTD